MTLHLQGGEVARDPLETSACFELAPFVRDFCDRTDDLVVGDDAGEQLFKFGIGHLGLPQSGAREAAPVRFVIRSGSRFGLGVVAQVLAAPDGTGTIRRCPCETASS